MGNDIYDVIIIGGGPAGLTAGIYTSRARLRTLILESFAPSTQAVLTDLIENYPGFPEGITGFDLIEKFKKQAQRFSAERATENVQSIGKDTLDRKMIWRVKTDKRALQSYSLIIASGARARPLGIPGENQFKGKGVSYCAVCDAPFFKGKDVLVVGGGNTAVQEALYLTKFASRVYLLHRRNRLRADKILQERAQDNPKIEVLWESIPLEITGDDKIGSVKIKNVKNNVTSDIKCDGVFIFIGWDPNTDFLNGQVKRDREGYIITDDHMATSRKGIFACGDCRKKSLRQVITACGDGATAAYSAQLYVENLMGRAYD
ncbi:MAG: thioredoxin-disulfide reductase [Spirochaetes bacterium]|nr:thioredoxin-disulfide reductase [Spirochaetota bacterium]